MRLAAAVGVSTNTVLAWVKRPDWPFGRKAPFDVKAVVAWRMVVLGWAWTEPAPQPDDEANKLLLDAMDAAGLSMPTDGTEGTGTLTTKQAADLQYRLAQVHHLNQQIEIQAGKFISREESDLVYIGMVTAVRRKLEAWIRRFPQLLAHSDAEKIRTVVRREYDRFCAELEAVMEIDVGIDETSKSQNVETSKPEVAPPAAVKSRPKDPRKRKAGATRRRKK